MEVIRESRRNHKQSPVPSVSPVVKGLAGATAKPMPTTIHPMLATAVAKPLIVGVLLLQSDLRNLTSNLCPPEPSSTIFSCLMQNHSVLRSL